MTVTIEQLANLVRTTPDRLREQLKEAGVVVTSDDQGISAACQVKIDKKRDSFAECA